MKFCTEQWIIDIVLKQQYWRAVYIDDVPYFRTFQENVVYFG